jgi:adenosylmethionine-8-amino-7-oxononanoate aminotransferase
MTPLIVPPMTLSERDKKIMWHPFTQEKTAPDVIAIQKASGAYLYDEKGRRYMDLISSWWVNIHGHTHPEIARHIYEQAQTLEHVMFAGFTHEPAVVLCEELQTILPQDLCRFFFTDNGSTAVEAAVKMAYQYWKNMGQHQRQFFLSFDGGYHGDTFGAMSVGARSGFHDHFKDLFFQVLSVPYPCTWDEDIDIEHKERQAMTTLIGYLDSYADRISAIILEPLIQGASGMRLCRASFLQNVINLLRSKGILIIFDEVMTGFCRTGTYFALDQLNFVPDFLCISKGISGGFLPLALTITTPKIYEAFLGEDFNKAFSHGHSYTANPLACKAAVCSLALLKETQCQNAVQRINKAHKKGLLLLKKSCAFIQKIRHIGTIAAFDIDIAIPMEILKKRFIDNGLLLRPLGTTVYLLPPYCVSDDDLDYVYKKISEICIIECDNAIISHVIK